MHLVAKINKDSCQAIFTQTMLEVSQAKANTRSQILTTQSNRMSPAFGPCINAFFWPPFTLGNFDLDLL